jgi:16S rRNA (cytidine1402-2'-O)-methyltransferase
MVRAAKGEANRESDGRGKSGLREERGRTRHPNRRPDASKPDPSAPPAPDAAVGLQPAVALPQTQLAPGLYLVATPIGNLGDITLRALAVLHGADRIFCEDTRVTGKLLARYGISKSLAAYHDHNAEQVRPIVLTALRRGERVALLSDAGTPLVSDPGYKLVRGALAEDLPVTALPGPNAAVTALILSGLSPDAFLFAGFLPPRQTARRRAVARWAGVEATLVFYETTPRLAESLADLADVLGNRGAAVARELTKLHEEVRRGRLTDLAAHYRLAGPPRGEAVVVVGPPEHDEPDQAEVDERLRTALAELGVREAAAKLAAETGMPRGVLYRRALAMRDAEE